MNQVTVMGVLSEVQYSHTINNVIYNKAILTDVDGNIIPLRFKALANPYAEGDTISITGNLRTYTHQVDGRNKVDIYMFTYFDEVPDKTITNYIEVDGRVCKIYPFHTIFGQTTTQIILANNIYANGSKLSSYLPCIYLGDISNENIQVNSFIKITGKIHSRKYKKKSEDESQEKIAYEVTIDTLEITDDRSI